MPGITIIGSGRYVPGAPVTNDALARVMDTDDAWIRQRTGIQQRHFAPEGVGASDLAVEAARLAIESAGIEAAEIDYIVFATMTPDYAFPGPGGMLGSKLGITGVPALDIRQQCAAMPFAFQVSDGLIATGAATTILVVGAEAHAGFMPWENWDVLEGKSDAEIPAEQRDRATRHRGLSVIFGDGAGALVMRRHAKADHGLIGVKIHSDGAGARLIHIDGGGFRRRPHWAPWMVEQDMHIPRMEGRELFKQAVTRLPRVVKELCAEKDVPLEAVDWFVAHQANDRINDAVRQQLKVPAEKVPSNIARYGNTSGATIPILVDEMRRDGRFQPGQLVCFMALGAGLHWGAALMRL